MSSPPSPLPRTRIEQAIVSSIQTINLSQLPEQRLTASTDAVLYGNGSPLDSLGLVSLLIEVEEALRVDGADVTLSDERAISQKHSPFRTVKTLTDYIERLLSEQIT